MGIRIGFAAIVLALGLGGCVPTYLLVPAGEETIVGRDLIVKPASAWNLVPSSSVQTEWEETWTLNGPLLDTIGFVGGLPDGKALLKQKKKADQRVPVFHADMTPQDLVSMIESSYRVRGITVFEVASVDPVDFLGGKGIKVRYTYAPNDGISKKGNCIARVIDKKLYVIKLEGASSHYFDAAMPEFEQMVASASLDK